MTLIISIIIAKLIIDLVYTVIAKLIMSNELIEMHDNSSDHSWNGYRYAVLTHFNRRRRLQMIWAWLFFIRILWDRKHIKFMTGRLYMA